MNANCVSFKSSLNLSKNSSLVLLIRVSRYIWMPDFRSISDLLSELQWVKHTMTLTWNLWAPKIRHSWRSYSCLLSSKRGSKEFRTMMKEWTYFTVFRASMIFFIYTWSRPSLSPCPGVSSMRTLHFVPNIPCFFICTSTPVTSVVSDFRSAEVLNRFTYPHKEFAKLLLPTPVAPSMQKTFV